MKDVKDGGLSELGFLGLEGGWLFGLPRPFVLSGCPHPGPLPLSGRGDTSVVDGGFS